METIRMTTAQALVRFLNQQFIEFDGECQPFVRGVFTIFGHGNVLGLGQALEQDPGRLVVHKGCNEQGMAHIAIGYARQLKRRAVYAVTSSVGPGAANMVTAAATATANRIPLLLLPGDTFACRQPDPVLQQVEQYHDGTLSTNDCFRPVSRYWDRVSRPEQLIGAMTQAMRVLTDPADTGAVTVCLPQDVQGEAWDFPASFFRPRVHVIERRVPMASRIDGAVALIRSKRRPMLICGGGVRYSEAHEVFAQFAKRLHIPFGETQAGKSAVTADNPLNCGGIGVTGCMAANQLAAQADLIIGVGTRLTDFTTGSKTLFTHPDVQFISINVSEFDSCKLDALGITADAREALVPIMEALEADGWCSEWADAPKRARQQWQDELERLFAIRWGPDTVPEVIDDLQNKLPEYQALLGSSLTQTRVLGILQEQLEEDAVVVAASGSLPGDLQRLWQPQQPDTYHVEYGYSCMGYEVAAAIGAKLACPDKPVYAFVGDGAYLMLHSELVTAIQENINITVLLFDNAGFGCINNLQMSQHMGSFATENRCRDLPGGAPTGALITTDFAMNARSYGCAAWTVRNEEELLDALTAARKHSGCSLIDIKVLPKTMTHGYDAWWRTGTAQVADNPAIEAVAQIIAETVAKTARY